MERKRHGLVSIGKIFSGLDKPVKKAFQLSPRRGTTSPRPTR